MKYRSDYVTNSSSNSFLLARKGGLSREQKEKIAAWAEEEFLGSLRVTPGDRDGWEELAAKQGLGKETVAEGVRLLEEGYSLWAGQMECFFDGTGLYESFWSQLEGDGFHLLAQGLWDL